MTVEETLAALVDRFNRRVERTPALADELRGVARTIAIRLGDAGSYAVDLTDGHLRNLRSGAPARVDLSIATDLATFEGLVAKEIGPMKALVTRRLAIDGTLEDKLLLRRLL
ncbi:MAG TPA: SCP2 sterol-binding domain-containing protein [Thermoplasmata archaeon]|nr:SCP2 sterol-binding domain-containing protein [Thermoplasmata archaeon]